MRAYIINMGAAIALGALAGAGCSRPAPEPSPPPPSASAAGERAPTPADARPVILAVGTSLTAGYGLDPDDAWPAILQRRIDAAKLPHRVVNAGVSGETSA